MFQVPIIHFSGTQKSRKASPHRAEVDNFTNECHIAFVVGEHLYLDDGLYQTFGGQALSNLSHNTDTYSIDLSKSWRPVDATLRKIAKEDAPNTWRQAYFLDSTSSTVYCWGGFAPKAPSRTLLSRFAADGDGGGSWSTETSLGYDGLADIERSHGGAVANTPDAGFYFGGVREDTDKAGPNKFISGYMQFNFKAENKTWVTYNDSRYSPSRTLYAASAHYVPNFGIKGLIMIFGGSEYDSASSAGEPLSMETIWFLDPVTHEWHSQKTSGDPPARRRWPCTVGAPGANHTYEIFLYGGNNLNPEPSFSEVYILSLPGFVWKRADSPPRNGTARTFMACARAGKRQMITVGGRDIAERPTLAADVFPKGLGIFDLTELRWKDEYDAGAAEYDSPQVIKSWNLAKVRYDAGVEAIFTQNQPLSNPSFTSEPKEKPLLAGVIAGVVVGSVSLVALAIAAAFFLRRRRRQRAQDASPAANERDEVPKPSPTELSTTSYVYELPLKQQNTELSGHDARYDTVELDASTTFQDSRKYN
ncbi:kelch repeat protein [Colletotrichum sojae]|uniref:Kelch repeat protein n=1 Tax=Colletotrichum sojae TaxID=2175907 RepID=A0A8H6MGK6_9PEZI|nr:kelch repeat protein [Colletotrichum sojae]